MEGRRISTFGIGFVGGLLGAAAVEYVTRTFNPSSQDILILGAGVLIFGVLFGAVVLTDRDR